MPSTVKKIPFKSFEVIWLRTVTLGTFGLGGAAVTVDATHWHDGGFGFFFGGIAVSLRPVTTYSKYLPSNRSLP